jgi:CBS domain-containing protein
MLCSEVMNRDVKVIAENEPTALAAEMMRKYDIGFIPVCDSDRKKLVGTITDRDIVLRLVCECKQPDIPVREVMTKQLIFCHSDEDVTEARELMEGNQVSRMIVLDSNEHIAGIISLADLSADDETRETLEAIKQP